MHISHWCGGGQNSTPSQTNPGNTPPHEESITPPSRTLQNDDIPLHHEKGPQIEDFHEICIDDKVSRQFRCCSALVVLGTSQMKFTSAHDTICAYLFHVDRDFEICKSPGTGPPPSRPGDLFHCMVSISITMSVVMMMMMMMTTTLPVEQNGYCTTSVYNISSVNYLNTTNQPRPPPRPPPSSSLSTAQSQSIQPFTHVQRNATQRNARTLRNPLSQCQVP